MVLTELARLFDNSTKSTMFTFLSYYWPLNCTVYLPLNLGYCYIYSRTTLLSLVAKKSKALWIARSTFALTILLMEGDKSGIWILNLVLIDSMSADQSEDSVHRRTPRNCATQGELVFGQAVFLPSPRPPPLARFVNPQPGPDLAARIQDGDLITNFGFFGLRIPVFSTSQIPANRLRAG